MLLSTELEEGVRGEELGDERDCNLATGSPGVLSDMRSI